MSTGAAPRNSAVVPPPPPTGSILQKQSSFSRPKNPPTNGAPAAAPGAGAPPPAGMAPASGAPTAPSPASGVKRLGGAPPAPTPNAGAMRGPASPKGPVGGAAPHPAGGAPPASAAAPASQSPSTLGRKNSMGGGNPYGSMGPGGFGSMGAGSMMGGGNPYGSMGPGGFGSMGPGGMADGGNGAYGSMAPGGFGSMGPDNGQMPSAYGGMNQGGGGGMGSAYGSMGGGGAGGMGSMYGMGGGQASSAYGGMGGYGSMGPGGMASSMNFGVGGGSLYGSMNGGAASGYGGFGSTYMPMGSMYGGGMSSGITPQGFAAQWGSLANMSMAGGRGGGGGRSDISSGYGGFAVEATGIDPKDLCPNIGTWEDAKVVKRSGKRGGNHLYSKDKREKPVATSNSNASAMTIKRKADTKVLAPTAEASPSSRVTARAASTGTSNGKARAKVPSNYNIHTLVVVDKASGSSLVSVKDPGAVVLEKNGKKETFEVDEALDRANTSEELDSVLLSELRGNWFNGHNSALMLCAGKGKGPETHNIGRAFVRKCMERLEKNEKDTSVQFDVSMTMVSLRGSDQCTDLLKPGSNCEKSVLGSSPVYGPCLLELETKVLKTADAAIKEFDAGLAAAKEPKEIVAAFLVLKTIKKGSTEKEVHLSSLCVAFCGETVTHLTDIKEKSSSSPHRLFRYAVDGACVTVTGLCLSSNDEEARSGLEVERKMREVKNQPPRSGNVKRFMEFTSKEITRQKEKAESASGSEKKAREAQIERMEEMVNDAKALLSDPEKHIPKGYSMGR